MDGSKAVQAFGMALPLWSTIPFAGMLLSIALGPLLAPRLWHGHFGKISAFWAVSSIMSLSLVFGQTAVSGFLEMLLKEYLPFIILMGALYVISGGILITGSSSGTPGSNAVMLLAGALLASLMGTTGAAMLLVRPLIRANMRRKSRTLVMIFFIFSVANIGGALTPLGDPPLLLGFLMGVPFFWTLKLLPHMLLATSILLAAYYIADRRIYRSELLYPEMEKAIQPCGVKRSFRIRGAKNLIFLGVAIGAMITGSRAHLGRICFLGGQREISEMLRDLIVFLMGLFSMFFTPRDIRDENRFTWFPLKEVAVIFAGLFITMTPCLDILQAGANGHLGFLVRTVRKPSHYFWATGVLSSFLDNAPAYLAFFKAALGNFYPGMETRAAAGLLIKQYPLYLEAISAGSVFFGAFTYIGNAPNFMVRSISEESGIEMPGFTGYILKYSLPVLLPLFVLETFIFFR